MATNAYAVLCESESVGKRVKSSKRKIKWKFILAEEAHETKSHDVVLYHSIMSGKKTVEYDGKKLHVSKKLLTAKVEFDYAWSTKKHLLRVVIREQLDRFIYNLYIDNLRFGKLTKWSTKVQKAALAKANDSTKATSVEHGNVSSFVAEKSSASGSSGAAPAADPGELTGDEEEETPAKGTEDWATFDDDPNDFANTSFPAEAPAAAPEEDLFAQPPSDSRRTATAVAAATTAAPSPAPAAAADDGFDFLDFGAPAPAAPAPAAPAPATATEQPDLMDMDALYGTNDASNGAPGLPQPAAPAPAPAPAPKAAAKTGNTFLDAHSDLFDLQSLSVNAAPAPAPEQEAPKLYGNYPAGGGAMGFPPMQNGGMGGGMGGAGAGGLGMGYGGAGVYGGGAVGAGRGNVMGGGYGGAPGAYGGAPGAYGGAYGAPQQPPAYGQPQPAGLPFGAAPPPNNGPSITSSEYNPFDGF